MKTLASLLVGFLLGLSCAPPGQAAQNTASGNYRIDAVMTQGGALLEGAAEVYVLDPEGNVVARRHAVPAVLDLGDGDFTAVVVYGNARARGAIEPGTQPGANALNLEAGEVRLDLVKPDGTRAPARGLSWRVYRYRPDAERGPEVVVTQAAHPRLTLDAGWYEVRARHPGKSGAPSTREHVIEVKAGRAQGYSIVAD